MNLFFSQNVTSLYVQGWLFATLGLVLTFSAAAQVKLTVSTDKPVYEYGEPIELTVRIENNTAFPFTLNGSSSCQANFMFGGYDSSKRNCTLDAIEIKFNPGAWRGWTWTLQPEDMGLPGRDGEHEIVGFYGSTLADTISISAPAYLGGKLAVSLNDGVTSEQVSSVRNSLSASVLYSFNGINGLTEIWQISGMTVDDAILQWETDPRFRSFEAYRLPHPSIITSVEEDPNQLQSTPGLAVYPNPCVSNCVVKVATTFYHAKELVIMDVLGRVVFSENVSAGSGMTAQEISLSHLDLAPGVYFVSLFGGGESYTATFVKGK